MATKEPQLRTRIELAEVIEWVAGQWARAQMGLPNEWRQGHWIDYEQLNDHCGTTCCVAGKATLMAGYLPALVRYDDPADEMIDAEPYEGENSFVDGDAVVEPGKDPYDKDNWLPVSATARDLLGLSSGEASDLFSGDNNIEDVLAMARRIYTERNAAKEHA